MTVRTVYGCVPAIFGKHILQDSPLYLSSKRVVFYQHPYFGIEVCRSGVEVKSSHKYYLMVDDPAAYHARSLASGGSELSPLLARDWGDKAAYSSDPDGHILAFAT